MIAGINFLRPPQLRDDSIHAPPIAWVNRSNDGADEVLKGKKTARQEKLKQFIGGESFFRGTGKLPKQ